MRSLIQVRFIRHLLRLRSGGTETENPTPDCQKLLLAKDNLVLLNLFQVVCLWEHY